MEVTVKLKHLRIAPRKVRQVADLIREKKVSQAEAMLDFVLKKAAQPLQKLLKSGVDSAQKNFQQEKSNLYISKITVDEAPKLKRWREESRGQPAQILKRGSHVTITLEEIKKKKKVKKSKPDKEKTKEKKTKKKTKKPREKRKKRPKLKKKTQKPRPKPGPKKIFRRKSF